MRSLIWTKVLKSGRAKYICDPNGQKVGGPSCPIACADYASRISRSLTVIGYDTNRSGTRWAYLVYCFQDIARYWPKILALPIFLNTFISRPPYGSSHRNRVSLDGINKNDGLWLRKSLTVIHSIHHVHECNKYKRTGTGRSGAYSILLFAA